MQNLRSLFDSVRPAVRAVLSRAGRWRTPVNWSRTEWAEETRAVVDLAACETITEYKTCDPIPLGRVVYSRGLARALTRYRQEWTFSRRYVPLIATNEDDEGGEALVIHNVKDKDAVPAGEWLVDAFEFLPAADIHLIEQLFWHGCTQAELGREPGISQRAVSDRRRQALEKVRVALSGQGCLSEIRGPRGA